ncbi:cytochrome c oxidase subunit 7C, mitochondrial-like [Anoplophora glabripennis]|uniref:cytochrome c oxidase subunit 7C, mitochondrial-like n=1 Tax=Anoplophora glabripennis TaxID=217634 RepID=UPI000875A71A|nr:cytochrome c oxidase subunit 7C, mitochondrial-like [Anoplophora glabripennis]
MFRRTGALLLKNIKNYTARRYGHEGGVPGENLPFGKSLGRPTKLSFLFMLYFGSGFWTPYFLFMYMYLK